MRNQLPFIFLLCHPQQKGFSLRLVLLNIFLKCLQQPSVPQLPDIVEDIQDFHFPGEQPLPGSTNPLLAGFSFILIGWTCFIHSYLSQSLTKEMEASSLLRSIIIHSWEIGMALIFHNFVSPDKSRFS